MEGNFSMAYRTSQYEQNASQVAKNKWGGGGGGVTPKSTLEYAPHDRYTGASNKQGILKWNLHMFTIATTI
jgi:hypothetical protein